ncbi:TetR family transcriptional regulator [Mycobacterium sp. E136]|uniref:TetR/AcrR family transcriptional regulator n=1 Tax=Mycobacterium sp. E136 TaxID=1834125 RepID=UPI0007FD983F|nr:TetR/AcrR family transcriptional regulator [Mycobacterium sp. E136]OBG93037.1 TetR family transcriptional regulator [Mycobacterium sp. E136]
MPTTPDEQRGRLIAAAEACFLEKGPSRTKVTHVAAKAGVHRTTVYSYFKNMDEILAACFVKATTGVVDAAEPYFAQRAPFIERLITGALAGLEAARASPTMRAMTTPEELARTHHAAEQSEAWRAEIVNRLAERFTNADPGEVRTDVPAHVLAQWVVRICFSLIEEPGDPAIGGDEGLLRTFLPRTIAP